MIFIKPAPELVALLRHLLDDVGAAKDGLQVQPRRLAGQPVVQHVLRSVGGQGGKVSERSTSRARNGDIREEDSAMLSYPALPGTRRSTQSGRLSFTLLRCDHPTSSPTATSPIPNYSCCPAPPHLQRLQRLLPGCGSVLEGLDEG